MSNYPPGYPQQQAPFGFGGGIPTNPRTAASHASVALWVIGGLGLLCGTCASIGPWIIPSGELAAQLPHLTAEQQQQLGNLDLETVFRVGCTVIGIGGMAVSLTMVISAGYVRRGSRTAAVVAIIATGLSLLWSVFAIVGNVAQAISGNLAGLAIGVFWVAIGGTLLITLRWLVQTFRMSAAAANWHTVQAQMWQYQQQAQQGYGYGPPGAASHPPAQQTPWMNLPPPPAAGGQAAPLPPMPGQHPPEPPPTNP